MRHTLNIQFFGDKLFLIVAVGILNTFTSELINNI
jgi:hypothetical protein